MSWYIIALDFEQFGMPFFTIGVSLMVVNSKCNVVEDKPHHLASNHEKFLKSQILTSHVFLFLFGRIRKFQLQKITINKPPWGNTHLGTHGESTNDIHLRNHVLLLVEIGPLTQYPLTKKIQDMIMSNFWCFLKNLKDSLPLNLTIVKKSIPYLLVTCYCVFSTSCRWS